MESMFDQIVQDIKALKIQSAINVAKKALEAIYERSKELKEANFAKVSLEPALDTLKETRPTEPGLRNVLKMYMKAVAPDLSNIDQVFESIRSEIEDMTEKIKEYGSNLIEDGAVIFTHCHSSSVTDVILEAHKRGKSFIVYNTETRPRFQGRITAKELADNGITVHHMVDSAGSHVLRKANVFLFGADAISSSGSVFNKVGTKMFAEMARRYDVKTFSVTSSLKFDSETIIGHPEKIEERAPQEVWDIVHDHIIIHNPAFDEIEKENIDAIISELGVLSPESFVSAMQQRLA